VSSGQLEVRDAVTGTVLGRDGEPLEAATVTLVDGTGRQLGRAAVNGAGRFAVPVSVPGTATVIVAAPGCVPVARTVATGPAGTDLGLLVLSRPGDSGTPRPGRWVIDPAHSTIEVTARHLALSTVHGRFRGFSGEIVVAEPLQRSRCEAVIDAASIDTANDQRDAHLRSADFLDVEKYPELVFTSTEVEQVDDDVYRVTGDLTIKDVTRPISVDFTLTGSALDPFGNMRVGFEGAVAIKRSDWQLTYNSVLETGGVLISDRIQVEFDVSVIKEA
jgi:polyisoprenoid-binding protein YceI